MNGQCIDKSNRCDQKIDCTDSSDEESCDEGKYEKNK